MPERILLIIFSTNAGRTLFLDYADGLYKNGNTLLHCLAEKNCYDLIRKYLEILEKSSQPCRQAALNETNRIGETAFSLATCESVKKLLEWSEEQKGFYYLSTPPTVLLMYSTSDRPGFDTEVMDFIDFLQNDVLMVDPIVADPNPFGFQLLNAIDCAARQPNVSALIVIYMSHGFKGYVETRDCPLRIGYILDKMCNPCLHGKPKV